MPSLYSTSVSPGLERRLHRAEGGSFEHAERDAGAAEPLVSTRRRGG